MTRLSHRKLAWALIGCLSVLAVTVDMTKSWMVADAAGGGEHSRLRLHDSRRGLKSVSIADTYITLCVCVCVCVCVDVSNALKM